jgi:hypothetical protein
VPKCAVVVFAGEGEAAVTVLVLVTVRRIANTTV